MFQVSPGSTESPQCALAAGKEGVGGAPGDPGPRGCWERLGEFSVVQTFVCVPGYSDNGRARSVHLEAVPCDAEAVDWFLEYLRGGWRGRR